MVLSILPPVINISIIFLKAFESHYSSMALQKEVPFRYLLLIWEIILPTKDKGNVLDEGPHDSDSSHVYLWVVLS